jgi:hypothetical protein
MRQIVGEKTFPLVFPNQLGIASLDGGTMPSHLSSLIMFATFAKNRLRLSTRAISFAKDMYRQMTQAGSGTNGSRPRPGGRFAILLSAEKRGLCSRSLSCEWRLAVNCAGFSIFVLTEASGLPTKRTRAAGIGRCLCRSLNSPVAIPVIPTVGSPATFRTGETTTCAGRDLKTPALGLGGISARAANRGPIAVKPRFHRSDSLSDGPPTISAQPSRTAAPTPS